MGKVFAVLFETAAEYGDFAALHPATMGGDPPYPPARPDHNQRQRAWLVQMANDGRLLACGPFAAPDGAGLWLLRAESREEAESMVRTSPRHQDGMLSLEKTRIVEWAVSIGKERFS
jgi:uncharacterized protein YciI